MTEHRDDGGGIRWNPEISLGAIIQAVVVMCAALAWLITGNIHMNDANLGLSTLQNNVTKQIDDLHRTISDGLKSLQDQITSTLPDQAARLAADDRRLSEDDARFSALENRLSVAEGRSVQNAADISTLSRLANTPLPSVPRR